MDIKRTLVKLRARYAFDPVVYDLLCFVVFPMFFIGAIAIGALWLIVWIIPID